MLDLESHLFLFRPHVLPVPGLSHAMECDQAFGSDDGRRREARAEVGVYLEVLLDYGLVDATGRGFEA